MRKRNRKELKTIAKRSLLGNYDTVAGAMLLGFLAMFASMIPIVVIMTMSMFSQKTGSGMGGGAAGFVAAIVLWYIMIFIIGMLFMIGIMRICYLFCTGQTGRVGDLMYGFKNHPVRFLGLSVLIMLISLLASVPGIALMLAGSFVMEGIAGTVMYLIGYVLAMFLSTAVMLRYFLAVFVLVEEPWRKVGECIQLSKEMMAGNKMRLLVLQLSFIGIALLNYLTMGIGMLWILPYIISTNICFYLSVKEETYGRTADRTAPEAGRENGF